ncbi:MULTISPECIES: branched-chain amino acid ABC transporter permease [Actibacterium]|uniref:Branched-chain amino acid transport system permease protein n=1 Tax=Actibacterium naphthalenivorans TaxID=1614693 RepID=A0A840CC01_9RHOB|nr:MULTISPECIES: branched-chain amino acid ABC transporter permease [Actibacterium]ALG89318.1 branched-chain amino acid ABC transporter permease [Actibacterium sp. EMB200-NS6]MBB4021078.1 branched-chain amino acid transport system permease protein [Actibacterium naphthalenivorans]
MSKSRLIKTGLVLAAFAVVPAVLVGFDKGYYYQIATLAAIFMLLAASLHLVTGVAGLLQLGHAAFYGVGAYVAAILGADHGVGFTVGLPLAGLSAAAIAFLVALPTMRLMSIYFAVATLAIGQMLYLVFLNWVDLTNGPNGVMLFSGINLFGIEIESDLGIYYVVAAVVAVSILVLNRLSHSYYGNALRSLREDDQCASAMGINVTVMKIQAFVISSFFAGIAGALWAYTTGYISPNDFHFSQSILILTMVVVGGLGSLPGVLIGALLLILLPEALRSVGDIRNIIVGLVMFGSILFLPKGLFGEVSALNFARRLLGANWSNDEGQKGIGWK